MCTMVYLASDRPLPTMAWDKDHPAFHVEELPDESPGSGVRHQFAKPFVYKLGSHQFCGCGFGYRYDPEWPDLDVFPDEHDAAEKSRASLANYLEAALKVQDSLEIWLCWAGDEASEPEDRQQVTPDSFLDPQLYAKEKILLTVTH